MSTFIDTASLRYTEVHTVVGPGNVVAVLVEIEPHGERCTAIGLYRIERVASQNTGT